MSISVSASDPLAIHLGGSVMDNNATVLFSTNSLVYTSVSGSGIDVTHSDLPSNVPWQTKYKYDGIEFFDFSKQHTAGVPLTGGVMSGELSVPQIGNLLNANLVIDSYNDNGAGTHYYHTFTPFNGMFNLATNGGGMTFPDGTIQSTSASPVATVTIVTGLNEAHAPTTGNTVYVFDTSNSVIELPESASFPVGTQMVFVNTDGSTLLFNPLCEGAGVVTSSGGKYAFGTTGAVCAAIKLSLSPITWMIAGELTA